jgi:hypothetical protein
VIGRTPDYGWKPRGHEITGWLDTSTEEVADYLILDDNDDGLSSLHPGHFIQTSWNTGLTFEHAIDVIRRIKYGKSIKMSGPLDNNF